MLRSIETRRALRRAIVVLCALIVLAILSLHSTRHPEVARAESIVAAGPHSGSSQKKESPAARPPLKPPLSDNPQFVLTKAGSRVLVYPPFPSSELRAYGAPVVAMLHGMCGEPLPTCDFWSRAGREGSFLVCPEGNAPCGAARDWAGDGETKATAIDASLAAVDEAYGAHIAYSQGDILIGFSRGAFVARDIAYARPGRWRALIFIGASFIPDATRLKASGVRRVVMAAGDHDGARPTMQRAAALLHANGLPARYISLGPIPHALPRDLERILREALRWVRQADAPDHTAGKHAS